MKRWPLAVLLIVALGAGGTAVYLYQENGSLRRQLAALQASPAQPAASRPDRDAIVGTAGTTPAAETSAVAPADPETPAAEPARGGRAGRRGGADPRNRGAENLARIVTDPEMRAATLAQFKQQVDRTYGDLFVKLGLDEVQVETLRTLLAERQLAQMEGGLLQRSAENDEARGEAQAWRDSKLASLEGEINGILGQDGMKLLETYQRTAPQRQAVEDISRRASYAGAPLSAEASDKLVTVMAQVQTEQPVQNPLFRRWNNGAANPNAATTGGASGGTAAPATDAGTNGGRGQRQPLTPDAAAEYLAALDAQNQAILQQAREFLDSAQLEALADRQVEQYQQAQQQMDIAIKNPDAAPGIGGRGGFGGGFGDGFGGRGGRGP